MDVRIEGQLHQLPQHLHLPRQHRFEAFVGKFAHIAGTLPSLCLVIAGSLAWVRPGAAAHDSTVPPCLACKAQVLSGIPLHFDNLWQLIMNDAGSLICWCVPVCGAALNASTATG